VARRRTQRRNPGMPARRHQLLCRLTHMFVSQNTALQLSAALLRAILVNHVSHSETNKQSRAMELAMKERLDEMETSHNKLEAELRR